MRNKNMKGMLEEKVNQKTSLNTGIIDFFQLARKKYQNNPLYPRVWHAFTGSYSYQEGEFKTLKELKNLIENERGISFHGLGYKTMGFFNQMLKDFGLEPFKIGGKAYLEPARVKEMRKYGIEPAHDRLYYLLKETKCRNRN
jgi:hypothetical protein